MFEQSVFFDDLKGKFGKSLDSYKTEIAQYRTGKATPKLLEPVTVNYYGVNTPLNQMASITVPDARLLMVQPFDRSCLKDIEEAIRNANLGFNPINDGVTIKVPIPALTEERRKQIAKQVKEM
jgi:ribosome recycling factor